MITLYLRNDSHTVNTKTNYKLDTSNTSSCLNIYTGYGWQSGSTVHTWYHFTNIYILHLDGSTTTLATNQLIGWNTPETYNGIKTKNINIPEHSLNPTDAIYITHWYRAKPLFGSSPNINNYEQWVSPQLGFNKLNACTITLSYKYLIDCTYNYAQGTIYWGDTACESKISGFDFSSTFTLSGTISDEFGNPIRDAAITISNGTTYTTTTDENGDYSQVVNADTYDIAVSKSRSRYHDITESSVSVTADTTQDITMLTDKMLGGPAIVNGMSIPGGISMGRSRK